MVSIACLRFQRALWTVEEYLRGLKPLLREAADRGAQIVVTPECALSGFAVHLDRSIQWDAFKEACEPVDGPRMRQVAEWAGELGIYLAVGYMERDGAHLYNSCAFWGPGGELIGNYRKTHIGYPEQNVEAHSLKGFIIDQRGRILARGNHRDPNDEVIIATTTLEDQNRLRAVYLRCRRPDLYEF